MSVYCLVHGSTQSPRGWELLVSELRSHRHECICVDLPTDQPNAGATRYAEVVGATLRGVNTATVVAHSASAERGLNRAESEGQTQVKRWWSGSR